MCIDLLIGAIFYLDNRHRFSFSFCENPHPLYEKEVIAECNRHLDHEKSSFFSKKKAVMAARKQNLSL